MTRRRIYGLYIAATVSALAFAGNASAIIVDGILDADYGAPLAVQTVQTQFGDSNGATGVSYSPGSELNAAYARVEMGRLYLMFTGNHESNFNKLEVFIDSAPGGENTLSATPDYDFNPGSGWISSNLNGLTFDTGFAADYHLFSRWGGGGNPTDYLVDLVDRQGGTNAMVPGSSGVASTTVGRVSSGSIAAGAVGPNASGTALSQTLEFAIDDTNALGVIAGTGAADSIAAAAVATGMEFSIALADLGSPASVLRISAMINNGDHNFLSNQFLGGLGAPQGNLGGDGAGGFIGDLSGIDLNNFAGDQFFTVRIPAQVPTPGTLALFGLGLAGLAGLGRHRKKMAQATG